MNIGESRFFTLCVSVLILGLPGSTPFLSDAQAENAAGKIDSQGVSVRVLTPADYHKEAEDAWRRIGNYTDLARLDSFLEEYGASKVARAAFSLRYSLVQESKSIQQYNDFIQAYPNRLGSFKAIQEVFELYTAEDRISSYLDFMRRYPATPQALIAKMQLQTKSFAFVCKLNEKDEYDAYIALFPDSPHVPKAAELALSCALENEKGVLAEQRKKSAGNPDRLRHLREGRTTQLVNRYAELRTKARKSKDLGDRQSFNLRAKRVQGVVKELYSNVPESLEICRMEQIDEVINALEDIQKTLDKNHTELLAELESQFELTRKTLREGFEELVAENRKLRQTVEEGFEELNQGMQQLHKDLQVIHQDLGTISSQMDDVTDLLEETNRRVALCHGNLGLIYGAVSVLMDASGEAMGRGENVDLSYAMVDTPAGPASFNRQLSLRGQDGGGGMIARNQGAYTPGDALKGLMYSGLKGLAADGYEGMAKRLKDAAPSAVGVCIGWASEEYVPMIGPAIAPALARITEGSFDDVLDGKTFEEISDGTVEQIAAECEKKMPGLNIGGNIRRLFLSAKARARERHDGLEHRLQDAGLSTDDALTASAFF